MTDRGRVTKQPNLTRAEKRVLALVSQSMTNREIASRLGVSHSTVKRHMENILRKLQLRNRVEAAIYALTVTGCPARVNAECPLAAWNKSREQRNGPIGQ